MGISTSPHTPGPPYSISALKNAARDPSTVSSVVGSVLVAVFTVYLGLSGGGYDVVVRSELGLVIWWLVILGLLVGLLPRANVPRSGAISIALLTGFLVWTWIGLSWSHSHELTLAQVGRLSTYLGIFVLSLCLIDLRSARALLGGIATGIAIVSGLAVLSKLVPSLFPVNSSSEFYATTRLSYPFDYADAVGEFAALGVPLLLYTATSARTLVVRAASAGALPIVLLCLGMTVSRGGILAAFVGTVVFLALIPNRIPRLPTLAVVGAAIAVLMLALLHRPGLRDRLGVAPSGERHSMIVICIAVVVGTALAQAALVLVMRRVRRPSWLRVSRRAAQVTAGAIALAVVVGVAVAASSGAISSLWHDFKQPNPSVHPNQYLRLLSVAGSHRYQYWQVALKAFDSAPLTGIGGGTFRFYWAQHQTLGEYVLNAHSLWFETLAETGLVGLLLLDAFFGYLVVRGAFRAFRAPFAKQEVLTAATAMLVAFCAAAAFDWVWQVGVIPMVTLVAAAVIASDLREPGGGPETRKPLGVRTRITLAVASLLAMVLIAIPVAMTVSVRSSQSAAARGDLKAALADANAAQLVEPGAATPRLQRALLLEQVGNIPEASAAIAQAIAREPDNAQLWLVASRLATESNDPQKALSDYNHAKSLDPTSTIFR